MQKMISIMQNDLLIWKVTNQSVVSWHLKTQTIVTEKPLTQGSLTFCRLDSFCSSILMTRWLSKTRPFFAFSLLNFQISDAVSARKSHFKLLAFQILYAKHMVVWSSCNMMALCGRRHNRLDFLRAGLILRSLCFFNAFFSWVLNFLITRHKIFPRLFWLK